MSRQVSLHALSPAKPATGAACNGCGACCALEPCPVARLFLLQWRGGCRALLWTPADSRYSCGMVVAPARFLPWLPALLLAPASRFFARRIALGQGCDADIEVSA